MLYSKRSCCWTLLTVVPRCSPPRYVPDSQRRGWTLFPPPPPSLGSWNAYADNASVWCASPTLVLVEMVSLTRYASGTSTKRFSTQRCSSSYVYVTSLSETFLPVQGASVGIGYVELTKLSANNPAPACFGKSSPLLRSRS